MKKPTLVISKIGHFFEEIILLADNNKRVCYCNKDVEHYFGTDNKLFHPDVIDNLHQKAFQLSSYFYDLAHVAASGETQYQTSFINEKEEKITIEWKTIPLPSDAKKESVVMLLIGKDISDECSKNEKIDDLEIQLNSVIEVMAGNYWWKDIHSVYKGFNQSILNMLGVSREKVIGHTDYDLPWASTADELVKNDQQVMRSGLSLKTEEEIKSANGEIRIFDIFKIPLKNKKGEIIGTMGSSVDITELKQAEEKAIRLKKEIELQQIALLEEQEKLITLAHKVAHDITSPLTALNFVVHMCDELPEKKRTMLKRATESILDIANNLLNTYRNQNDSITSEMEPRQPLLVSDLLIQLLSEKKAQYCDHPVTFNTSIADDAQFAFIQCQTTEFRRTMSNMINNAVDALKDKADGVVTIQLATYDNWVVVEVADNGCGMPSAMKEKMRRRQSFTSGKENGHGLGLQQVWDTLEYNEGSMDVQSTPHKGTSIKLTFAMVAAPGWIAQDIHLIPNSIIVILDDDESIHSAWNLRFISLVTANPTLRLHHFTQGQEMLDFLVTLSQEEKNQVVFLSDYELLHQDKNGLQIIEASEIKGATLVTSYYSNQKIREEAGRLGIKVLPKRMASVIPVYYGFNHPL